MRRVLVLAVVLLAIVSCVDHVSASDAAIAGAGARIEVGAAAAPKFVSLTLMAAQCSLPYAVYNVPTDGQTCVFLALANISAIVTTWDASIGMYSTQFFTDSACQYRYGQSVDSRGINNCYFTNKNNINIGILTEIPAPYLLTFYQAGSNCQASATGAIGLYPSICEQYLGNDYVQLIVNGNSVAVGTYSDHFCSNTNSNWYGAIGQCVQYTSKISVMVTRNPQPHASADDFDGIVRSLEVEEKSNQEPAVQPSLRRRHQHATKRQD